MPATYSIDVARKLVTSLLWGGVTDQEVHEHNEKLRNDPQFDPSYRQLADMSGVTEIKVGTQMIRETAHDQFFNPGTRRAFVATSDAVYGMARMFAMQAEGEGQHIQVFRTRQQAEEWLGL